MRILLIHNDYGKPSGEEHACKQISEMLTDCGCEVFWHKRSSSEIGNNIINKAKAFISGIYNPYAATQLFQRLDRLQPDVILVQNIYPFFSPSIFHPCKQRNIPVVMRCPNYRLFCPSGSFYSRGQLCKRCLGGKEYWCVLRNCESSLAKSGGYALRNMIARMRRSILNGVDIFIVLSEFQRHFFISQGIAAERVEILNNAIADATDEGICRERVYVTYAGRVSAEKGIHDFLVSARALPNIPFVVAGDNARIPGLLSRSPANVQWMGFLDQTKMRDLYGKTRIFVCPSSCYEGFPNVVAQAMVSGCPVIAPRMAVLEEIVDHGVTGILYEPFDLFSLSRNIHALYYAPELCVAMGKAGREKALRLYNRDAISSQLMSIITKAIIHNRS